jgi:tRNA(Ile)-lysidine synthase
VIELLRALFAEYPAARRWVVAFSGGLDSTVLLHLCAAVRDQCGATAPQVLALHVDHAVHPESAAWADHCRRICAELRVAFHAERLQPDGFSAGANSESRLREARYGVFEQFCTANDVLLLAHHRDDQAETVLLRLVRGAGAAGLSGMPRTRALGAARLCRPLLDQPRERLREYATAKQLQWIEDPGNAAIDYARNFLRAEVLPLLADRWPGVADRIVGAARHCADAAWICDERAQEDIAASTLIDGFGQVCLDLGAWQALPVARGRNLLRAWIATRVAAPVAEHTLRTIEQEIIGARRDAGAALEIGNRIARRFRDRLYLLDRRLVKTRLPVAFAAAPGFDRVVEGAGRILLGESRGVGVRAGLDHEIRFRSAGVFCKLAGRPRKSLKKLFQELDVPPWLRDRLPLLYVDGELAAIGQLCVCENHVAAAGDAAIELHWDPCAIASD